MSRKWIEAHGFATDEGSGPCCWYSWWLLVTILWSVAPKVTSQSLQNQFCLSRPGDILGLWSWLRWISHRVTGIFQGGPSSQWFKWFWMINTYQLDVFLKYLNLSDWLYQFINLIDFYIHSLFHRLDPEVPLLRNWVEVADGWSNESTVVPRFSSWLVTSVMFFVSFFFFCIFLSFWMVDEICWPLRNRTGCLVDERHHHLDLHHGDWEFSAEKTHIPEKKIRR